MARKPLPASTKAKAKAKATRRPLPPFDPDAGRKIAAKAIPLPRKALPEPDLHAQVVGPIPAPPVEPAVIEATRSRTVGLPANELATIHFPTIVPRKLAEEWARYYEKHTGAPVIVKVRDGTMLRFDRNNRPEGEDWKKLHRPLNYPWHPDWLTKTVGHVTTDEPDADPAPRIPVPKREGPTKTEEVKALMMRKEGVTLAEVQAITVWAAGKTWLERVAVAAKKELQEFKGKDKVARFRLV